jgi:hypothetical protein
MYVYYYYHGCTALCWVLAVFSVCWSYTQWVGLLGRGSARRKASTYTQSNTNRINPHNTHIHALSAIRTHDPNVRARENRPCLRPRGKYNLYTYVYTPSKIKQRDI